MALNEGAICLYRSPGSKKVDQHEPEVEKSGHDHDEISFEAGERNDKGWGGAARIGAGQDSAGRKHVGKRT
jgi:hypothetical protein